MAVVRRVAWGLAALAALVAVLLLAAAVGTQTRWFREWARGVAERQAGRALDGRLSIGRLEGNLFSGADLFDVRIHQDGREVVAIERLHARYSVWQLASGDLRIASLRVVNPTVILVHDADGWRLARLFPSRTSSGPARAIRLASVVVENGTVRVEDARPFEAVRLPSGVSALDADMALTVGDGVDLDVRSAAFQASGPALRVTSLAGHWVNRSGRHTVTGFHLGTPGSLVEGDFSYSGAGAGAGATPALALRLTAKPLSFAEWAPLVPSLADRDVAPSLAVTAEGPLDRLAVKATVADGRAGEVRVDLIVNAQAARRTLQGLVVTNALDLAPIFRSAAAASRLTVDARLDLAGDGGFAWNDLTGPVTLRSSASTVAGYRYESMVGRVQLDRSRLAIDLRGSAYGAAATSTGTITPAAPVRYALRGRVAGLDLRRLPAWLRVPELASQVTGAYTVTGTGSSVDGAVVLDDSTIEGAALAADSRAYFTNVDGTPRYGFTGRVAGADVARLGRALEIPAITEDDFTTSLNGQVTVDGTGSTLAALRLDATAALDASTAFMSRVGPAEVAGQIADRRLTVSGRGDVSGVDLSRFIQRDGWAGVANGHVDARATIDRLGDPFDIEHVAADGTITITDSTLGPLEITGGSVTARTAGRTAEIVALDAHGPRLDVTASGPVAFGTAGDSALQYHVSMTRLADIGPLVGRDLDGRVALDGTITGNRVALASRGTAAFSGIRVDDVFEALTAEATFDASLPDFDTTAVTAVAKVESTLPTIAGRELEALSATLNYANSEVRFDATVRESGRSVSAAGLLVLSSPEYREVRIERLGLATSTGTWSLDGGRPVALRYGADGVLALGEEGAALVNGTQRITASGSIGVADRASGAMAVAVDGADLGGLGDLLLLEQSLGGTLTGTARITGTPANRRAVGRANVAQGTVDGYAFESLDASLDYVGGLATVDARLRQAPGAELTAAGTVPLGGGTAGAAAPISLDLKTAGIDLGVLAAATPWFTAVSGQLVADVHVGGTRDAPRVTGAVTVAQGAFTLAATGAAYSGATIDARLEGDNLQISSLSLRDAGGHALEGSGRLRFEGRAVQDIDLIVNADRFTVLNNGLGELAVNATLNLYGTVRAPKVAGLVRLSSGRLEVDALVDRFASSPYAQDPEGEAARAATARAAGDTSQPITLNVTVQVPDNLVLRGRNIRTRDSAVSLGGLNLTAGGDFTLRREGTAGPTLIGTIETVRGTYDFQGRRFTVLRNGRIAFRGDEPIDPALDVSAERVISGIVARVNLGGSMRDPRLTLSSQPPLDEADVLSLIVFNQPVNRLGEGQRSSLGKRAALLAGGFVVSPLADSLGRVLDLDVFELDASSDNGGGPAVTVGEQVGERLFVKFRKIFGTQDVSEFQLEYQLSDFLRLQGSIAEGQGLANRSLSRRVERGGIDLVVFFSY